MNKLICILGCSVLMGITTIYGYSSRGIDGLPHAVSYGGNFIVSETLLPNELMRPFVCYAKPLDNRYERMTIRLNNFAYKSATRWVRVIPPSTKFSFPQDHYPSTAGVTKKLTFSRDVGATIYVTCFYGS